jgi:hypothetical protein
MPGSPFLYGFLLLVLIAFMLVFALGTQRNIQKGNTMLRWIQEGLPALGRRTTVRWLGSSAVQLKIVDPQRPFREAEVVVVLEPRDLSWLWVWSRARGRRDFVIMRARLERSPRFELEAGDPRGWTGEHGLRSLDPDAWVEASWDDAGVRIAHSPDADPNVVRAVFDDLQDASGGVWRLSVRRDSPHIEVHVLPPPHGGPSTRLFESFRDLARAVMKPA